VTSALAAIVVPALAALVGLTALGRPRQAAGIAVGGAIVTFAVTTGTAIANMGNGVAESASYGVIPDGTAPMQAALRLDGLSATVAIMVAAVALAVQIYSVGYLDGDPRYPSYAALVSLFTAAMMLVVHADDLIVLLVGWEVMGICSYFLVAHHWERQDARRAGVKAFLVTRIGDIPFMFGIFGLGLGVGTFKISDIELLIGDGLTGGNNLTVVTLLLLGGVVGKSAQFPLHVWLPDAMAGPTPVSALIHAATMVAAGVFLVARLYDVFLAAPVTLAVLAVIAAITMLGSALAALVQLDIKRVLAYSTISQLAYMLVALGVQAPDAGTFHLITHGAFKALLFLSAGALIHVVGTNLLTEMGGLRALMPVTFVAMTVGLASLVGIPPFSGFFSKEAVLVGIEDAIHDHSAAAGWVPWFVLVLALLTVAVTAAYATRVWLLAFFGPQAESARPHEVGWLMRGPLIVLAVASLGLGAIGLRGTWLPAWLSRSTIDVALTDEPVQQATESAGLTPGLLTTVLSLALAAIGAGLTYAAWRRTRDGPAELFGRVGPVLDQAFHVDALYDRAFVRPSRRLAEATLVADRDVVGAAVSGSGTVAQRLGAVVRRSQDGDLQRYLTVLLAGTVLVIVAAWTAVSG
jgi:NADH-quinone oxidoreductase subunit L